MPRFLSPIYVKQEFVTGNEVISGNETILGVTSGKDSYWTTVNSELSVSSEFGYFNTLSANNFNILNIDTYSISSSNIESVYITALTGFYNTLTASNIKSDYFIGDGSNLTNIIANGGIATDPNKLPLSGGVLIGGLIGTDAYFNILSSTNISGTYYGDGSKLTGVIASGGIATDPTKLPLSGGSIIGNLLLFGGLTALSGSTFVNTIFTTTSALSIINSGLGPALYVLQGEGEGDIASFYDGDGIEVLHIGNALNPVSDGVIGIKTSFPNKTLTVIGEISATNSIWSSDFYGNANNLSSIKWDSNFTTVNANSSKWESTYTTVNANSSIWNTITNSSSYVTLTGTQTLKNKTIIDWMTLVRGYNTTPVLCAAITNGNVYVYTYDSFPTNIIYYRYIANDNSDDSFYSYFNGNTLSGLIASKKIIL